MEMGKLLEIESSMYNMKGRIYNMKGRIMWILDLRIHVIYSKMK